jgi:autotransporter passenger strand-loop-strand repeat protein/autotransporter-associated beta strand protein
MNGIASNFILYDKGYMHVSAGGSALDVTQHEGANVNVHIVGGDTSTYVSGTNASGDTFTLENGVASNFILYDEGTMHISAGGSAISTTISSGGSQVVSAGGTASATIVSSGGTLVGSGGTLAGDDNVIYDGGILSGDSLILDDDATLTQEVSAGNSVSQDISLQGSGSFIKTGDGTLTLTGAMGSADPAGSDDAFSYAGTITNDDDGTLAFNQSIEQTLVGVISGTGALEKDGTGKLILNHADNSAAAVNVSGGSLIVGGASIHSAASLSVTNAGGVNVYNGALLGGHGTIDANDVIIHSGGTLSPGNGSYGTTTISGKLSFSSGAYFDVQVDPASDPNNPRGDRTTVTDIATLAGTVRHISTGGMANDYLGKDWLILSALNNQLVNEFNSVESDLVFLLPQLRQEANEVFLFFTKISLNEPAQTRNEYAVADALESLNPDGSLYQEIVGNVTKDQARRILNELSGEIHASLKSHLFMQDTAFLRRLARHVGTRRSALGGVTTSRNDAHSNFWVSVNQGHNALDGDGNAGRSILTGTEIAGGHDANLENGWLGGLAFRLHDGRQEVNSRRSEADLMSYAAALYGGRELLLDSGTLRFLLSGALTRHDVESTRKILIGTRDQKVKADYSGLSWQGAFETAYRFSPTERLLLEPYASVALHSLRLDGFTEKGGNAALRKRKETWNHTVSLLGLRMTTPLTGRVTLDTDLAWKHVYGSILPKSVFTFREGSDRFAIVGPSLNRNAAIVGLGVGIKLTDTAKLGLSYDGELSGKGRSHAGKVLLEVRW